ncbi:MAG: hypothetical protein OXC48_00145 [Endozoicomonadaceae bacterium]|nr:hypothetical protein [Endozoicomonadaceae bacterium]
MPAISSRANTKTSPNILNPDNVKDFQATQGNLRNFGEKKDIPDTQNSADKRNSEIKNNTSGTGKASGQSRALSEIAYTNYKNPDSYNQITIDEQKTDSQVKSSTNTTSAYGRVNGENQTNMFMKEEWKLGSTEDTVQQSFNVIKDKLADMKKIIKEMMKKMEKDLEYREEKTDNTHFIRAPAFKTAALFGYPVMEGGMCHSSAKGGLLACIRQGVPEYMERMKFILDIMKDVEQKGYTREELYKTIKEKCLGGIYGKNAHQILNFFDEIMLSSVSIPDDSRENLGHPGRQSLEFPRSLFGEDEFECRQPHLKDKFIAHFSSDEIKNFLQKLRDENGDKPWGMAIGFGKHIISIGFDGTRWLAVNSDDQIYTDSLDAAINVAVTRSYIRNGYSQAVLQILGNEGDNLSINQQEKVIISGIKNSEEYALKRDLHLAMQHGFTETAEMLIDKIVDSSPLLSEQQKIIYRPVISQKGSMKKIEACIDNIKIFFQRFFLSLRKKKLLSAEERKQLFIDLLKAKDDDCLPLRIAMQYGYAETAEAYIKKIAKIINNKEWLSAEEKKQILIKLLQTDKPEAPETISFLFSSIFYGHMETATAYIQAINNISWLSAEEKKQVILQLLKNDDGYSICAAILNNNPKALEIYMEEATKLIKSLSLSAKKKAALLLDLLTVKVDGNRGRHQLNLFQNYEVMKVYIHKIVQAITEISPLSSEEKTALLEKLLILKSSDDDEGSTVLVYSMWNPWYRTAVKEYMKTLMSELKNIIPAEKQKQFMTKLLKEKGFMVCTPIEIAKIVGDEEIIKLFDQALGLTREVATEQH